MISYAMLSKEGNRQYNEDTIYAKVKNEEACFILADGLGGQGNGDVASTYVKEIVSAFYENENVEDSKEFVNSVVEKCQKGILRKKREETALKEMMSTLILLLVHEKTISWGHVGDSRLYYFQKGKMKERTIDHSVPQVLASAGQIKDSEIRFHPDRNRLLRAIGMEEGRPPLNSYKEVDRDKKKHIFLLCSDGFWEYIEEKEMERALKHAKNPEQWLKKMEKIVIRKGKKSNMDNYSAICIFVE